MKQEPIEIKKTDTLGCIISYNPETRILNVNITKDKGYAFITIESDVIYLSGGVSMDVQKICDTYNVKRLRIEEAGTELWNALIKEYTYVIEIGDLIIKAK